jgi:hypothetical protein
MKSNVIIGQEGKQSRLRHIVVGILGHLEEYPTAEKNELLITEIEVQTICTIINTIQFWYSWWPSRIFAKVYPLGYVEIQK